MLLLSADMQLVMAPLIVCSHVRIKHALINQCVKVRKMVACRRVCVPVVWLLFVYFDILLQCVLVSRNSFTVLSMFLGRIRKYILVNPWRQKDAYICKWFESLVKVRAWCKVITCTDTDLSSREEDFISRKHVWRYRLQNVMWRKISHEKILA